MLWVKPGASRGNDSPRGGLEPPSNMTAPWLLAGPLAKGKGVFEGLFPPSRGLLRFPVSDLVRPGAAGGFPRPHPLGPRPGPQVELTPPREQAPGVARKGLARSSKPKEACLWKQPPHNEEGVMVLLVVVRG